MPDNEQKIRTEPSIRGFIASDPRITFNDHGEARFYARYGVNEWHREDDGSFTKTGTEYYDLVQFGKAAELSYGRFRKGDDFIAQGHARDYPHEVNGEQVTDQQFVARRIGHDPNTTTYEVIRGPRADREAPGQDRALNGQTPARQPESVGADRDNLGL
jgi:single-strand DNA-binding protein